MIAAYDEDDEDAWILGKVKAVLDQHVKLLYWQQDAHGKYFQVLNMRTFLVKRSDIICKVLDGGCVYCSDV